MAVMFTDRMLCADGDGMPCFPSFLCLPPYYSLAHVTQTTYWETPTTPSTRCSSRCSWDVMVHLRKLLLTSFPGGALSRAYAANQFGMASGSPLVH